jgi:hypothetical protein
MRYLIVILLLSGCMPVPSDYLQHCIGAAPNRDCALIDTGGL